MAARSSMATLIARMRVLIGDPTGTPHFSDDDLQAFLDERRMDVGQARLRTDPTPSGGSLLYTDFYAPRKWWEDSVVLTSATGTILTPTSSELVVGHWSFAAGVSDPVYITGSYFDLYGAAQAACEAWAAAVAREFDFATDQQTFDRTGKRVGLLAAAREYARKAVGLGQRPAWRSPDW